MNSPLITEKQAAEWLSLKPSTLRRWRWSGIGPEFVRIGQRAIRYRLAAVEAFARASPAN